MDLSDKLTQLALIQLRVYTFKNLSRWLGWHFVFRPLTWGNTEVYTELRMQRMRDLFTISEHVQHSEQRTSLSQHLMVECDLSLSTKVSPLCCCDVLPREFTMQQPADLKDSTVQALTSWSSAAFHVVHMDTVRMPSFSDSNH